eukprot:gene3210-1525_t
MCRAMLADQQWEAFGENPREEVMMLERILLQTIKFDLQVDHPYQYLIKYGKDLKGDKERINELVQKAWIFINDSLSTCICLHYKPSVVALAMFHLAAKLSKQNMQNFTPVPRQDWWRLFLPDVEQSVLDDICNEMMDLYDSSRQKSKSREGSVARSKDGSVTESPGYTPSGSPQVTGSPPSKKKRSQSSSLGDGQKAKDSPMMKPLQVENVSPPMVVKALSNPPQPPQSTPKPIVPTVNSVQSHGHFFQQGYETVAPQVKDGVPMVPDITPKQPNTSQQILNPVPMIQNPQTLSSLYPHGMPVHNHGMPSAQGVPPSQPHPHGTPGQALPPHGQVMPPRDQIPMGIDQGHYAYNMAQPQQPPQQQQFHSYMTTQLPTANQWQTQQPGIGPGWMK